MTPCVALVGASSSGKTTLLEKLVREFKGRGLRVGTIKHAAHGFELDRPGTDSWRHAQAGAEAVVLASPEGLALLQRHDRAPALAELVARFFGGMDLVLAEGFKREATCRVEVHRAALGAELVCRPEELLAVATDEPLALDVPQLDLNDAAALADFLVDRLLKGGTSMSYEDRAPQVELQVNGAPFRTNAFVATALGSTLRGLVSALRDVPEPQRLEITVATDPAVPSSLQVNGEAVELNPFVQSLIRSTLLGMVSSLEGGEGAQAVELKIAYG